MISLIRTTYLQRLVKALGPALVLTALTGTAAVAAGPTTDPAVDLAGTVDLRGCSGSLVRMPNSTDTDPALVLTNGHCYAGTLPIQDEVILDQPAHAPFDLLDSAGKKPATLQTSKVAYATMTGTDVTLYQLDAGYAQIANRYHVQAREVSAERPAQGTDIRVVSGGLHQIYSCRIDGFAYRVAESAYVTKDVIRYTPECGTVPGTSGSPIVDAATGKVVGVNNTSNRDGGTCTENNPCEMDRQGHLTVHKGTGYGTQTYRLTTCVAPGNTLDLTLPGCLLPRPQ